MSTCLSIYIYDMHARHIGQLLKLYVIYIYGVYGGFRREGKETGMHCIQIIVHGFNLKIVTNMKQCVNSLTIVLHVTRIYAISVLSVFI